LRRIEAVAHHTTYPCHGVGGGRRERGIRGGVLYIEIDKITEIEVHRVFEDIGVVWKGLEVREEFDVVWEVLCFWLSLDVSKKKRWRGRKEGYIILASTPGLRRFAVTYVKSVCIVAENCLI